MAVLSALRTKGGMMKQLTTMRGFAETPCKKFQVKGKVVSRKEVEKLSYAEIAKLVKTGRIYTTR